MSEKIYFSESELAERFGYTLPTVSHHVAAMRESGRYERDMWGFGKATRIKESAYIHYLRNRKRKA